MNGFAVSVIVAVLLMLGLFALGDGGECGHWQREVGQNGQPQLVCTKLK